MAKKKKSASAKKSANLNALRRSKHTRSVLVPMPEDLYEALRALAFEDDRAAGAMVRSIVKGYINQRTGRKL